MKSPFSRLSIIKLPKTKRFEFSPRYYDEAKERMEQRKRDISKELGLKGDSEHERRTINFRAQMNHSLAKDSMRKQGYMSNVRLIVILGLMLILCYYIYINLDEIMGDFAK